MKITDVKLRFAKHYLLYRYILMPGSQVLARLVTGGIYRPQQQPLKVCRLPDRKRSVPY